MSERAIRSIVVAGGGIVGLSAALAFSRSLPRTKITVVETPPDPAALADRMPTAWPTISRFHALIGLDEIELLRSGIATHHVGTVIEGWPGKAWVHAFAPHGRGIGPVPFDQIWSQAKRSAKARSYDTYSMGAALTRAGKFVHPSNEPDSLPSRFVYGLRVDPELYRERLAQLARSKSVEFASGEILGADRRDDGGLHSLRLSGDRSIEADMFIDGTGPAARVLSMVDGSFQEWPSHRATALEVESQPSDRLDPTAGIRASEDGWVGEWPLRDRVITCTAGPDAPLKIRPGRRLRPWSRNVLALGDAATAIDPLHGLNLDLTHRSILLALELLPGRDFNPLETGEYNRRAGLIADQAGDFVALHYARSGRTGPVWQAPEPPDRVARILDQYQYRGRLPFREEQTLTRDDWTSALLGLGVIPANVDPAATGIPLDQALEAMEKLAGDAAAFAARAPAYEDYLKRITGAA